ncbi:hypothetical protein [Azospirillum canadense]|uniref:hypothetical protein n=1 Tax=Azospirillum canadense TaxID=403962 RepID=UPI002227D068|nr:hypothetical protein [Azospirillum canadense]MCW2239421.1 hypothetical protein [Azospirillum canadense]
MKPHTASFPNSATAGAVGTPQFPLFPTRSRADRRQNPTPIHRIIAIQQSIVMEWKYEEFVPLPTSKLKPLLGD